MALSSLSGKTSKRMVLGLWIAIVGPFLYPLVLGPLWLEPWLGPIGATAFGLVLMWLIAGALILVVRLREGRTLASMGFVVPSWRGLSRGLLLGFGLMISVPLLQMLVGAFLPVADLSAQPLPAWLVMAGVLTAAMTEEIIYRGYLQERLYALSGSATLSIGGSLILFGLAHLGSWPLGHLVGIVVPLGLALGLLYHRCGNLWLVILVHLLIDLPLFVIALMR